MAACSPHRSRIRLNSNDLKVRETRQNWLTSDSGSKRLGANIGLDVCGESSLLTSAYRSRAHTRQSRHGRVSNTRPKHDLRAEQPGMWLARTAKHVRDTTLCWAEFNDSELRYAFMKPQESRGRSDGVETASISAAAGV